MRQGKPKRGFTDEAIQMLMAHTWPGNVRELENKIKVACLLGDEPVISGADLGLASVSAPGLPLNLKEVRNRAEREAVTRAITASAGNISRAAELLGVSRPTLYDLMSRHDLAATRRARDHRCGFRRRCRMKRAFAAGVAGTGAAGRLCAQHRSGHWRRTGPGPDRAGQVGRGAHPAQEPAVEASDDAPARVLLAQIALDEGNAQAASDELSTLDEAALQDPQALLMWVRVDIEIGKPEVALQRLHKSGASIPQPDRALVLASAYRATGSQADALAVLREVEPEVGSSEALALGIADTLQEMGNFELATVELNRYLASSPASTSDALRMRGDLKLRQGKPADAVADFQAALKAAPAAWPQVNRIGTELMIADAQIAAGEIEAAKAQLAKVEKRWPGTLGATVLLGQIALLEGRPEEAVDRLGAVDEAGAGSERVQYLLVEALLKSGNVVRASQLLETLVAKEPESSPSRRVLATLFLQQGRPDRVIEILGADEEPGVDDDVNVNDDLLSVARLARAQAVRRISTLTEALAAAPANSKLRAELAAAQLANGDAAAALDTLGPFVEGRQDPVAIGTRVSALYAMGNDIEANQVVDRLLSTPAGSDLPVLLAAADAAAQRQQNATVSRLLDRADVLAPANPEVQLRRANLDFANKDYDAAAKLLDAVLQREPGNVRVRLALARVAEARGDVAGSREALEAAVEGAARGNRAGLDACFAGAAGRQEQGRKRCTRSAHRGEQGRCRAQCGGCAAGAHRSTTKKPGPGFARRPTANPAMPSTGTTSAKPSWR